MQTIFTPWRFRYISMSDDQEGCFVCQAADEPDDPQRLVGWVSDRHLVMLNRDPYTTSALPLTMGRNSIA